MSRPISGDGDEIGKNWQNTGISALGIVIERIWRLPIIWWTYIYSFTE
jgi:hypothetical protein